MLTFFFDFPLLEAFRLAFRSMLLSPIKLLKVYSFFLPRWVLIDYQFFILAFYRLEPIDMLLSIRARWSVPGLAVLDWIEKCLESLDI